MVKNLDMTCDRCRVRDKCPKAGSSPLRMPNNQMALCRIIGGYGREPLDLSIASEASKKLIEQNGPCLTIAEVPEYDIPSKQMTFKVTKIFHEPILHERETISWQMRMMYPESHKP